MTVQGWQLITFEWSMVVTTLLLVCLRLYVQIRIPTSSPPLRTRIILEVLVVIAWLFFLLSAITDTILIPFGGYEPDSGGLAPGRDFLIKEIRALKVYYAQGLLYLSCMYAIKCHMLIFYRAVLIAPNTSMRKTHAVWKFTCYFLFVGWLLQLLLAAFACLPVSTNWDPSNLCTPYEKTYVYVLVYAPHLLSDLLVYFLPFPVLLRLRNITVRQRLLATFSFGFGFLCVSFAATQVACNSIDGVSITANYITAVMEQTWAMLVVCVPALKVFLRGWMRQDAGETSETELTGARGNGKARSDGTRDAPEEGIIK